MSLGIGFHSVSECFAYCFVVDSKCFVNVLVEVLFVRAVCFLFDMFGFGLGCVRLHSAPLVSFRIGFGSVLVRF